MEEPWQAGAGACRSDGRLVVLMLHRQPATFSLEYGAMMAKKRKREPYVSPETIRKRCAAIRAGWNEGKRKSLRWNAQERWADQATIKERCLEIQSAWTEEERQEHEAVPWSIPIVAVRTLRRALAAEQRSERTT
jgi:hypothetical protein